MSRIIALGASNSQSSINKKFATWAANMVEGAKVELLDLNDYQMPMYSADLERVSGIPDKTHELFLKLGTADGFVISMAEHNGNYTAVFKNTQDWLSRIDRNIWRNKSTLLLSTSPGKMGGQSVLKIAETSFTYMGAKIMGTFSLPGFFNNFNETEGILSVDLAEGFQRQLSHFMESLSVHLKMAKA